MLGSKADMTPNGGRLLVRFPSDLGTEQPNAGFARFVGPVGFEPTLAGT
jgi:hypothetical protein